MSYRINVSKSVGPNWDNSGLSYIHYFEVVTDLLKVASMTANGKTLVDLVGELRATYPSPDYKVSVYKLTSYSQEESV